MTPEGPRVVLAPAHAEPDLIDERPAVALPAPTAAPGTHRVVAGETLYRIARGLGITPGALAEMNGISVSTPLAVGHLLVVPAPRGKEAAPPGSAAVRDPGDEDGGSGLPPALAAAFDATGARRAPPTGPSGTGGSAARAAPASEEEPGRERAAPVARRDPHGPGRIESTVLGALPPTAQAGKAPVASVRRSSGPLQWPLRGVLYARFGRKGRSPHDGIDLAAPAGTPVRTAGEGSVLFAGPEQGYGLLVIVEHAHGLVTVYAHNRDLRVKTGQPVRDGQVIATVGESGKTSGPHLHFEVRQDGAPVDPLDFLGPPPTS
jgi:lipoprotein NlpD